MAEEQNTEFHMYDVKCKDVLKESGVRFAAIINRDGKMIAGGFGKGISPLEGDEEKLSKFMKYAANVTLQSEYDNSLGALNYIASRRDKIILVSFPFPVSHNILLVSAEPGLDIEKLANIVVRIFGDTSSSKSLSENFPGV